MLYNKLIKSLRIVSKNHRDNTNLPFITNSATIRLDKLREFISELHKLIDAGKNVAAVKLYFIREEINNGLVHVPQYEKLRKASDNYSQISIAIVPHNHDLGEGQDIVNDDGSILCLLPGGENSGLCPPHCSDGDT